MASLCIISLVDRIRDKFPMKPMKFKLQSPSLAWSPYEFWDFLEAMECSGCIQEALACRHGW